MLNSVFATKLGMTQAWTTTGKRVAVTRCKVEAMHVVGQQPSQDQNLNIFEIGYGSKKLKNMAKPLRSKLEKGGFSFGMKHIKGLKVEAVDGQETPAVGSTLQPLEALTVGDVVKVQGITKGKGFAGAMKRHNFKGGSRTHGQSDRARAVGSIGAGTTPGRVLKGKRMPGRMGTDTQTISGLVVLYINPETQELWLSGPVPGFASSTMTIRKTGETRDVTLDLKASGIKVPVVEESTQEAVDEMTETAEATTEETQA